MFRYYAALGSRAGSLSSRPRVGRRSRSSPLQDLLARVRGSFAIRSRMSRELIIFGSAFVLGLVGIPLAIWFVGNRVLGPYTHGTNTNAGPLALVGDFFVGLSRGWTSYWVVVLGPAAIILFTRVAWALIKFNPGRRPVTKDRL